MSQEDRAVPSPNYGAFSARFPRLRDAWDLIGEAGKHGPLDEKTIRLVKLGIAIGAQHQGAVHASLRKASALGITREEIDQVVTLAAGTLGLPQIAAVFSWLDDEAAREK